MELGRLPIAKNDSPGKYKEPCIVSHLISRGVELLNNCSSVDYLHKHPGETREHQILQVKMRVMFKASSVGRTIIGTGRLFKLMFLAVTSSSNNAESSKRMLKSVGI